MKKWSQDIDISIGLQRGFIFSALLTLFVGMVGLYAWNQQKSQITYALNDDFPKIQASFHIEEHLNLLFNEFNELVAVTTLSDRLALRNKLDARLLKLTQTAVQLDEVDKQMLTQIQLAGNVLVELDQTVERHFLLAERFTRIASHIEWLHDDFHAEFSALLQDINWQQSSLLEALTKEKDQQKREGLQDTLRILQDEFRLVYRLMVAENQIVHELKELILRGDVNNLKEYQYRLSYLKQSVDLTTKRLVVLPSTVAIRQIVGELLELGLFDKQLPFLLIERDNVILEQQRLIQNKDEILSCFRRQVESQIGGSHKQLQVLHNIIEKTTRISGLLIVCAMIVALLFVIAINHFYIRPRLLKRFYSLNHAVKKLNRGEKQVEISVYGEDELGRIADLLRHFSSEVNKKNNELNNRNELLLREIGDRIETEKELISTQHELVQTAKMAVVGQTLTTMGHEINQPLNALGAYIFSAKRALQRNELESVETYLEKMQLLVERTGGIIRRLRQFTRRGSEKGELHSVDIKRCAEEAWSLLETRHRPLYAELELSDTHINVLGDEVLLQQVLVNLFTNALEATSASPPQIKIVFDDSLAERLLIFVSDNGCGWPLELVERLLQPFASSKSVNLGIGLSISCSIMNQCAGELRIASTLDRHALVILELRKPNHAD